MMQSKEKTTPIPGVWATIAAGFDVTTRHFWLTLIPVLLDSFFWLGPRLSFRLLVERMVAFWQQDALAAGVNAEALLELAPRTNLFTSLSVPLIGVPALMVGVTPKKTPLPAAILELDSVWLWLALFVAFSLIGLLLTAVYWGLTAHAIRQQDETPAAAMNLSVFMRQTALIWLKLLGLGIAFAVIAVAVYMPLAVAGMILALFSEALASIVLLVGPVILMWLVIYLSFAPHGIVLNGRPLWRAMLESWRLVRRFLLPALSLLLLILLIGRGLDWLLLLADDGSWLTWASIWGHAFVNTALAAAVFIFYRDRYTALFGEIAHSKKGMANGKKI